MKKYRNIKTFLTIVVVLSVAFEGIIIVTKQMTFAAFLLFSPALAAVLTKLKYHRKEKNALYFRKCKLKYLGVAFLLPCIYLGIPYGIFWLMNPASMQIERNGQLFNELIMGLASGVLITVGEEIGWRGFLVPRLTDWLGVKKALLISGFIWGAWHCPLLIAGIYIPEVPVWYKLPIFMLVITGVGVMMGVLTLRSKSVWPAVLMHAVHNTIDQSILGTGTVSCNKSFFVSEAGILTAIVVIFMAMRMYKKFIKRSEENLPKRLEKKISIC